MRTVFKDSPLESEFMSSDRDLKMCLCRRLQLATDKVGIFCVF